jgi:hypothetical protein
VKSTLKTNYVVTHLGQRCPDIWQVGPKCSADECDWRQNKTSGQGLKELKNNLKQIAYDGI